jgi:hypothetical protein
MDMNSEPESDSSIVNPIDAWKTASNPGLLPYAHTVGGAIIKPIDKGRTKGNALQAMYEQTNRQLDQIRKQVELLMTQAQGIHDRVEMSERIYKADMNFKPVIGHTYHLYERQKDGKDILSMIAPKEWGANSPMIWLASLRLLADHTWEILAQAEQEA